MKRSIVSPGFVKRTLAKLLKLDQQLGIVVDGNVASKAIADGKYVNLINSTITGKPDGIYVATGAVSSGGTVTAADISGNAVSDGVTNELSEQIGKISISQSNTSQSTSTSSGTFKTIQSFSVSESGSYLIVATAQFSSDTNGIRILVVTTDSSGDNSVENSVVAFGRATLERIQPMILNTTDTVYIRVYQNSGSNMNVLTSYRIVRIA